MRQYKKKNQIALYENEKWRLVKEEIARIKNNINAP